MGSRRAVLRSSAAAGIALVLDGCGGAGKRPHQIADAIVDRDVAILNHALGLERRAIAAYTAGIPLLNGRAARAATEFLPQELAHAGMLLKLISKAGGPVAPRAQSYDLGRPGGRRGVVELLHDVERAQLSFYVDAVGALSPGHLRAAVASILADDAQHVSVLRSVLGLPPAPSALVSGGE